MQDKEKLRRKKTYLGILTSDPNWKEFIEPELQALLEEDKVKRTIAISEEKALALARACGAEDRLDQIRALFDENSILL